MRNNKIVNSPKINKIKNLSQPTLSTYFTMEYFPTNPLGLTKNKTAFLLHKKLYSLITATFQRQDSDLKFKLITDHRSNSGLQFFDRPNSNSAKPISV
jgi:hypothetical protein